jgi:hypothetical protein
VLVVRERVTENQADNFIIQLKGSLKKRVSVNLETNSANRQVSVRFTIYLKQNTRNL